jgi:hypothetical protein
MRLMSIDCYKDMYLYLTQCNQITASCVAYDSENKKRLIVTADSGKDSMIVVWDADTASPLKTIFSKT